MDITKFREFAKLKREIQKELGSMHQYVDLPYEEMVDVYDCMKPKQAEKFIEGWVANLIGGKKLSKREAPTEFAKNDLGDIQLGKGALEVGVNNVELKVIFQQGSTRIGGGQLRFFEPVAYYMFFKPIDRTRYEMFLLTKEQLVNEIKERARTSSRKAFCSSQGSNDITGDTEPRLARLDENLAGVRMDKICWDFNMKTEPEYYERFKKKYLVTAEELQVR